MSERLELGAIGWMRCDFRERYETPHQAALAGGNEGWIELRAGADYEQALTGLEGVERIWVIFGFHLNAVHPPPVCVKPPRHGGKVGVFATRSPHRPNGLGLSCVRVLGVEGRRLRVAEFDILDGSPIFDLKPYIPAWDAFPDAKTGWIVPRRRFDVVFEPAVEVALARIADEVGHRLDRYALVQLQFEPLDARRKRITLISEGIGELAYREFRLRYRVDPQRGEVRVVEVVEQSDHDVDELERSRTPDSSFTLK